MPQLAQLPQPFGAVIQLQFQLGERGQRNRGGEVHLRKSEAVEIPAEPGGGPAVRGRGEIQRLPPRSGVVKFAAGTEERIAPLPFRAGRQAERKGEQRERRKKMPFHRNSRVSVQIPVERCPQERLAEGLKKVGA